MRRSRRVLAAIGCAAAGAAMGAVVWPWEREPEYNGRKLSEWLARADCVGAPDRGTIEAEGAVRCIGRDAVPLLLRWISYEPSAARAGTYTLVSRYGRKIGAPRGLLNGALALLRNQKAEER